MSKATSSAPSQRMLRVGEQVRAAVTQVLQRGEVRDPLIETTVISISEVRMSPDLKIATSSAVRAEALRRPVRRGTKRGPRLISPGRGPRVLAPSPIQVSAPVRFGGVE